MCSLKSENSGNRASQNRWKHPCVRLNDEHVDSMSYVGGSLDVSRHLKDMVRGERTRLIKQLTFHSMYQLMTFACSLS